MICACTSLIDIAATYNITPRHDAISPKQKHHLTTRAQVVVSGFRGGSPVAGPGACGRRRGSTGKRPACGAPGCASSVLPADRMLLTALAKLLPRQRWAALWSPDGLARRRSAARSRMMLAARRFTACARGSQDDGRSGS
jgi:hypothetical protein